MTPLDKLKQTAENNLKEKFSCIVYPYSGTGIIAINVVSNVRPKLTEQEEGMFIAGFQERIKFLKQRDKR